MTPPEAPSALPPGGNAGGPAKPVPRRSLDAAAQAVCVAPVTLQWHWARFEDLGVQPLYDILALRCRVFVLEQGPFLDPDGADPHSWHLQGRDESGVLQAYLRAVDPGIKYAEPSIGRVVIAPEVRCSGLGRRLMHQGLARCALQWPGQAMRISAQARLHDFYASLGFEAVGAEYIEDQIPHLEMLRKAP